MALKDLMALSVGKTGKIEVTEERLREDMPAIRDAIAFWREYPDLFVEQVLLGTNPENFRFYTYQRLFVRANMRHKYFFATFPRGFSKSFLSVLSLCLSAILFPGSQLFVSAAGKDQSGSILSAKVTELCRLIPGIHNEIDWRPGRTRVQKENVRYIFKNNSSIEVLAASERSRGQRKTSGILEECAEMDGDILNAVLLPTMSINRRLADGSYDPKEVINKKQCYITTAGYCNTFAYSKLVELFIRSVVEPESAMIIGGSWRIPVLEGLYDKSYIDELRMDTTYTDTIFEREFNSVWSQDVEDAFFSGEIFDKRRVLQDPEFEPKYLKGNAYYALGVDVGRLNCTTEVLVFRVMPQTQGPSICSVVNCHSYDSQHFETQAINLKKLYFKYKARVISMDINGIGRGILDYMVKSQNDPETGDYLPPFGLANDEERRYVQFITPDTVKDAIWGMVGNPQINTEIYTCVQMYFNSNKIKLLTSYSDAKSKLMATKKGQQMPVDERERLLAPHRMTDILKDQMLNLSNANEGTNIILKQSNRKIPKDRFSALGYGLYYVRLEDERKRKRRGKGIGKLLFFS